MGFEDPVRPLSGGVERVDTELETLEREAGFDQYQRDLTLPPHSLQAEEAVLGSILKTPASLSDIADLLRPDDFYSARNRHVYTAMLSLFREDKPVEYHHIGDREEQLGIYEPAGGLMYLSELNLSTPSSAFIRQYAAIVERTSIMRQLIKNAQTIAELAYRDNLDPDTAIQKSLSLIESVSRRRAARDFRPLEDILGEYMEQVAAMQDGEVSRYGIPTGYMDLDKLLGGLQRTDLIVLAARTSVGKTSFVLNVAVNACLKSNATVAIFSVEMAADQLAARLLSMESGVDSPRIRSAHMNEQESRKVDAAMNHLAQSSLWVDDSPSLTIDELVSKARRLANTRVVDMIVIDYLQLLGSESGGRSTERVREIGEMTRRLKALARELNVPVVCLSQLSRAVEQRSPHIPMLSDLRESGNIEQDADVVIFLYRDEKYNPDTDKRGVVDVIVSKHRNGPTGQVQLLFLERTTKFLDLEVYRA